MRTLAGLAGLLCLLPCGCNDGVMPAAPPIADSGNSTSHAWPSFQPDAPTPGVYGIAVTGVGIADHQIRLTITVPATHHPTSAHLEMLLVLRAHRVSPATGSWCGEPAVHVYQDDTQGSDEWFIERSAGAEDCACGVTDSSGNFTLASFVLKITRSGRTHVNLIPKVGAPDAFCDCEHGCVGDIPMLGGWVSDPLPQS